MTYTARVRPFPSDLQAPQGARIAVTPSIGSALRRANISHRAIRFRVDSEAPFWVRWFICFVSGVEAIIAAKFHEVPLDLFAFDRGYLERLRAGDAATEGHFVAYFGELLLIKLRARRLPPEIVQELRQETFIRVFRAIRADPGIRQAEKLGAFVNSVCTNVLREHYRAVARTEPFAGDPQELPDRVLDLESFLVTEETREFVRQVLAELPGKDVRLLRAIFFEEKDKSSVCNEFGVDRNYLRVLLFRAKERFRARYRQNQILKDQAVARRTDP